MLTYEYFEHQFQVVREIHLSERKFYQEIINLYVTAFGYYKDTKNQSCFSRVYRKNASDCSAPYHAELIVEWVDMTKDHMGLTTWELVLE